MWLDSEDISLYEDEGKGELMVAKPEAKEETFGIGIGCKAQFPNRVWLWLLEVLQVLDIGDLRDLKKLEETFEGFFEKLMSDGNDWDHVNAEPVVLIVESFGNDDFGNKGELSFP